MHQLFNDFPEKRFSNRKERQERKVVFKVYLQIVYVLDEISQDSQLFP
jgi:hypothetical protein